MDKNQTYTEELAPRNGNGNGYQVHSFPLVSATDTDEDDESLDLRQLWTTIRQRKRLIAAVTLGIAAAVSLWTFSQEQKYKSQFQILISSPDAAASPSVENIQLQQLLLGGDTDIDFSTKIAVLGSPNVLEPIVEQIARQYPEVDYEDLIAPENSPLIIEQLDNTKILQVSYEDEDPQKVKLVLDQVAQGYLRYSLDERQEEIGQGMNFVEQQLPVMRQRVDQLQARLQEFRQKHNLLDPERQASDLATQLVSLEEKYFDTQVQLKEANSRYQILQGQLGLQPDQAITSSYLSESPRYQSLLDQLQEIEVELADQSVIFSETSPNIEVIEEKREKILALLRQEAQAALGSRFSEEFESRSLASPSELRLGLNQQFIEVANDLQVLELRRGALEQATNQLKGQINQIPALARQYTDIQRELQVASENLVRFLQAEKTLELDAAQQALKWKIIAPPEEPEVPIASQSARTISLGVIGGLMLGVGAAFLAERLAPVLRSCEDLEKIVRLPLLGRIPLQKDPEPVEPVDKINLPKLPIATHNNALINLATYVAQSHSSNGTKHSPYLEAFRSLNTNLRLLGEAKIKGLVIASPALGEGKSTVAVRLAEAAAQMGQRVLLVDADLRRSQVYRQLSLENNNPGLSNVLADGLDVEEVVRRVPERENLFVLASGEEAPDPLRLLSSTRMQQIAAQVHAAYDLVVYDTPALLDFADGRILAAYTDGALLVAKMHKTNQSALQDAISQLKLSHVPIFGVVANGVSLT